ncbi:hypothetical protein B7486_34420 [cyanobacterium TDX16]|nr:hypothetical protein B7486_34420 [cyanobacterium TDX16]
MEDEIKDAELANRLPDKDINEAIHKFKAVTERQPIDKVTPTTKKIWQRGDRAIATGSGGALLGGIVAQLPGAIAGAIFGALYGLFVVPKETSSAEN